jgi:hypothetical protein
MQFVIEMVWLLMKPLRQNRFCLVLFFVILIVFVFMYYSPVIKQLEIIYFKHFHPHRKPLVREPAHSTCNEHADQRGPHQKVIAYSVYGDLTQTHVNRRYLKPLLETTKRIVHIYSGISLYFFFCIVFKMKMLSLKQKFSFNYVEDGL